MNNQVKLITARTYDRTGYETSNTRYTVVDNQSLAEDIAEDLALDCLKELNYQIHSDVYDDFTNEEYTKADIHKRYIGDEDFPELKYITVADKDVPEMFRIIVEITSSTLIKQRDDYFSLRGYDDWARLNLKNVQERIQMNENIKNMVEELKEKYPDDYGHFEGLTIDAIDRKDCDDTDDKFNEKILRELKICYKGKIIVLEKYYNDDWEIRDKHFLKTKEFREIVEILSIVMKHLSKIEFI